MVSDNEIKQRILETLENFIPFKGGKNWHFYPEIWRYILLLQVAWITFGLLGLFSISQSASQVFKEKDNRKDQYKHDTVCVSVTETNNLGFIWRCVCSLKSLISILSKSLCSPVRYSHRGPPASSCRAQSVHWAELSSQIYSGNP